MKIAMIITTSFLTLMVLVSAAGKLRKMPSVVEVMTHVGVKENQIPLLALIEIAGGVGLLIGFATSLLGRLAAGGLVLYFLGAVIAHLRVKDSVKDYAPAAFLFAVSVLTLVLQIER
jgi:uncharacterized membrane protein YphA (DoxX/SURF4 family)